MYIHGSAPVFKTFDVAAGPGVHADEADAALADLAGRLQDDTLRSLLDESSGEAEVRANPPEEDEPDDAIVYFEELLHPCFLITGQWGPDPSHVFDALEVRANPPERPRDYTPFFPRMARCRSLFVSLRSTALARYEAARRQQIVGVEAELAGRMSPGDRAAARRRLVSLRAPLGPYSRPWLSALDRIIGAIDFILAQERRKNRSILDKPARLGGTPFGIKWAILAAKGNQKLPFISYSELPMSTCPGAGNCRVPMDPKSRAALRQAGGGWCYSFKAFRYPNAWGRMALNTLANYADREFSIMRAGGPSAPDGEGREDVARFLEDRVAAAIRGRGADDEELHGRVWMQYVKGIALSKTRRNRRGKADGSRPPKISFMRLFVDGDVNTEDNLAEWMEACRDVGRGGRSVAPNERHMEVYGYSKCWAAFTNLDAYYQRVGSNWPDNYTVNLSSGSVYAGKGGPESRSGRIRIAMEGLPVSRGYFEAIPVDAFIAELEKATKERKRHLPMVGTVPFAFSERRIEDFTRLNRVRSVRDLDMLYLGDWRKAMARGGPIAPLRLRVSSSAEGLEALDNRPPGSPLEVELVVEPGGHHRSVERQVRRFAFREYLSRLLADDASFGALVRREIARDENFTTESEYLAAKRQRAISKADDQLVSGKGKAEAFTSKALLDKALAMSLHEVMWSFGLGGSCPLVCGNCADTPDIKDPDAVHRCASRTTFKGKTIKIGLH